jgi:hypothetical protein
MSDLFRICRNHWDRTAAVLAVLGGFGALVGGWAGARQSVFAFRQIPYLLSGGLAGVCLVGVGAALWLSADLRDEWRKLDRLEEILGREIVLPEPSVEQRGAAANGGPPAERGPRITAEP